MPHIRWVTGGEARVVEVGPERVVLASTVPGPPGARLEGILPSGAPLRVKVHVCRRTPEGFQIQGRPLDCTRPTKHELEALPTG